MYSGPRLKFFVSNSGGSTGGYNGLSDGGVLECVDETGLVTVLQPGDVLNHTGYYMAVTAVGMHHYMATYSPTEFTLASYSCYISFTAEGQFDTIPFWSYGNVDYTCDRPAGLGPILTDGTWDTWMQTYHYGFRHYGSHTGIATWLYPGAGYGGYIGALAFAIGAPDDFPEGSYQKNVTFNGYMCVSTRDNAILPTFLPQSSMIPEFN
jgi:hypothetical protein